ncbi:MAG: TrmH family RNA methyltransferase [Acidobacteriota bacterium]
MKSESRRSKILSVLSHRQCDATVVIENIHDPHNVSAIFRSADAVGIPEVQLVYTNTEFPKIGKKSSSSANKWVGKRRFRSVKECYDRLHEEGYAIYATRLDEKAQSLYDIDLTKKIAIVMGNEHAGVSDDAAGLADGTIMIPMMGMIQSLNVSVATAVTLYEMLRQRRAKGMYDRPTYEKEAFDALHEEWLKK